MKYTVIVILLYARKIENVVKLFKEAVQANQKCFGVILFEIEREPRRYSKTKTAASDASKLNESYEVVT